MNQMRHIVCKLNLKDLNEKDMDEFKIIKVYYILVIHQYLSLMKKNSINLEINCVMNLHQNSKNHLFHFTIYQFFYFIIYYQIIQN